LTFDLILIGAKGGLMMDDPSTKFGGF